MLYDHSILVNYLSVQWSLGINGLIFLVSFVFPTAIVCMAQWCKWIILFTSITWQINSHGAFVSNTYHPSNFLISMHDFMIQWVMMLISMFITVTLLDNIKNRNIQKSDIIYNCHFEIISKHSSRTNMAEDKFNSFAKACSL